MADNTLRFTGNFVKRFDALDLNADTEPSDLLDVASLLGNYTSRLGNYDIGESFYLESLTCTVNVGSLGIANIPDIAPEDTNSEKQKKWYESVSRFPRIGLALYQYNENGAYEWIDELILQNRGIPSKLSLVRPVLTMGNLELFKSSDRLGIKIVDKGFGKLGLGDFLVFRAAYRVELDLIPNELNPIRVINHFTQGLSTFKSQIRNGTNSRKLLYISNSGDNPCWIVFSEQQPTDIEMGAGIYLPPEGGAFSFEPNRFTVNLPVWGYTESGTTRISGMEAYS